MEPRVLLPRLSLRKIACFVATADAGSVSAAAQRLGLSQAGLSEALSDLEKDLGINLFIRQKAKGVTITCAGQQILPEARQLVRQVEEFQALTRGSGTHLSGELTIGCFHTFLPILAPALLTEFTARHPNVKVRFVEDTQRNLEHSMLAGTIDMSILYDIDVGPDFERQHLYYSEAYVLLSPQHRLANSTDPVDLSLLVDDPYIQLDGLPGRNDHVFSTLGMKPQIAHRSTNFEMIRALVARNHGYAVLIQRPKHCCTYEGLPLVIRPIANPVPPIAAILGWPSNIHLPRRGRAFINFCLEFFKEKEHR
ncbi:LysR substrate-binding domain-containing protein [Telmatospirillum siberiense]|uniref:LysR family transcriptional regulator n=1 Tax=Telmatospirillum siberiense TaxID=382514 RepID=A0A2N3PXF8_9PROT|nr:LysR substrate-binding domain-containing protein [Telmatospirillum siberiense]PKU25093.1 LysR family transcriptional regulator [Telmatospirillum siberiense]